MTKPLTLRRLRPLAVAVSLLVGGLAAGTAQAGPTVTLSADARGRVANDEMVVTLAVERDGADPGAANEGVVKALNDAIERAKKVPGVQARVGSLATHPTFNDKGKPAGYRVRGEVVLESRNFSELAALSGSLAQRMLLAGVAFRASSGLRDQEEKRLLQEAANAFRARSRAIATAFGMNDSDIREVSVGSRSGGGPRPMAVSEAAMRASPLPTEGGDSEVVVSVNGKIELK